MTRRIARISLAAMFCLSWGTAPALEEGDAPDVREILAWLDDMFRSSSSVAVIELTIVKPRRTRTLRMKAWTKGTEKALMLISAPPKFRGYATLKVERNLWNYMAQIARTIRIPPSMMLGSWMGTDFTNDDLVRESSLLEDFDVSPPVWSEEPAGWLLDLAAKEGSVGLWDRIEYVVSPDGRVPLLARYYDRKGRLARIMRFSEVKDFGGRTIPSRLVLIPMDDDGSPKRDQRTEMRYVEVEFDASVPEETFSLSRLERKR